MPNVNALTRDARDDILAVLHEFLAHRAACHYSMAPNRWAWHASKVLTFPYYGDCSSTASAANYFGGGNDPSALNFLAGDTATMLHHAQQKNLIIPRVKALPCDFAFFGWDAAIGGPEHVAMFLQHGALHRDPLLFNMGSDRDPSMQPLSVLMTIGKPLTFARNVTKVPNVLPRP